MRSLTAGLFCLGFIASGFDSMVLGQMAGSRAGQRADSAFVDDLPGLQREVVDRFITMDGRAEIRIQPTEIRIVLAVTGAGERAQDCQAKVREQLDALRRGWIALGMADDQIIEDFISVLPQYEWVVERNGDTEIARERLAGFRMQTNVHLSVPNDGGATQALSVAFEQGVTDIIAFDYWSRELAAIKKQAQQQAIRSAQDKTQRLFSAIFDQPPPVINIQEKTTVYYPADLYASFENTFGEQLTVSPRRDMPFIRAPRPQNTYYRGLVADGDAMSDELPMRPEISVVSTVRLYFQSPAAMTPGGSQQTDDD